MRFRLLLLLSLFCGLLTAQDAALKDTFLQAKALWATQGDREGATARFDTVVAALAPKAAGLEPEWSQVLCESYNWLAVLDDRSAQSKARAQARLQALLDLNPDFELDKALTSQRLAALFERMKSEKYALVKLSFLPEGGRLVIDGRPFPSLSRKFLPFGTHKLSYTRPGHAPAELTLELGPHDAKSADFKLTRTASTITLYVQPRDVEVLLDGQSLGYAIGQGGPEAAALALPLGLRPEDFSAAFVIPELHPGKHRLELRAPCLRTKVLELGADLATPAADHTLEPIRLEPSLGSLSISSPWPGGELFLSGQSKGPLPQVNLPVCTGAYDLLVRFPSGGFAQRLIMEEGKAVSLEVRPKPRLAFAGLEGGDFTGRARFLALLQSLGDRLQQVAFLSARPDEPPADALARLQASREAELILLARTVPDPVIHRIELVLRTLDGEEERLVVKPLEQDPLASLAVRLNAVPSLRRPGLGATLLDVPGEPGPWVLAATEPALKAGLQARQAHPAGPGATRHHGPGTPAADGIRQGHPLDEPGRHRLDSAPACGGAGSPPGVASTLLPGRARPAAPALRRRHGRRGQPHQAQPGPRPDAVPEVRQGHGAPARRAPQHRPRRQPGHPRLPHRPLLPPPGLQLPVRSGTGIPAGTEVSSGNPSRSRRSPGRPPGQAGPRRPEVSRRNPCESSAVKARSVASSPCSCSG
ncbi:MAG: hypothetical protein IPN91_04420 [Holophagaceae bacterium]|uniref:PEGA domain-containing protein n=1 Tax=Candidatus Geothrix odensensis TaxID=2954440 RepID=A0A936F0F9_9BACT|nr:hypothetical protein [Candidatus Geothrix odensensis]